MIHNNSNHPQCRPHHWGREVQRCNDCPHLPNFLVKVYGWRYLGLLCKRPTARHWHDGWMKFYLVLFTIEEISALQRRELLPVVDGWAYVKPVQDSMMADSYDVMLAQTNMDAIEWPSYGLWFKGHFKAKDVWYTIIWQPTTNYDGLPCLNEAHRWNLEEC